MMSDDERYLITAQNIKRVSQKVGVKSIGVDAFYGG